MQQFDCTRSSALDFQFPPPAWTTGVSTGSTNSEWKRPWSQLNYWTEQDIAEKFTSYWNDCVTPSDKRALIANHSDFRRVATQCANLGNATFEAHIRMRFDLGISSAHRTAISDDNGQPLPSDLHSTIRPYQNLVFGEPDYLLQNPNSLQVVGICEAKSPWNIGPSEIDDVLMGTIDTEVTR
jgi:hypothetical protein